MGRERSEPFGPASGTELAMRAFSSPISCAAKGCAKYARLIDWQAMARRVDRKLTQYARNLRAGATEQERALWRLLSRYRPKFTRQLTIAPFIADLACREARLVVEIDGSQHADSEEDLRRTELLQARGWTVIRFWNSQVNENPEGVAAAILQKAAECLGGTHPQPLPSREGRTRRPRQR